MSVRESLREFPQSVIEQLPPDIHTTVLEDMEKMVVLMGKALSGTKNGSIKLESNLSAYLALFHAMSIKKGRSVDKIDLGGLICSQELVMLFAHLQAFMADTVRTVCRVCPDVLKSSKELKWENVLACGGWDELLNYMIEKYTYDFGWVKPIGNRLKFLIEQFGLEIDYPADELKRLEEAEQIRHILVHDGGRINQEFVKRTGREDLTIGEPFKVTLAYNEKIASAIAGLISAIYECVAEKSFGKDDTTHRPP